MWSSRGSGYINAGADVNAQSLDGQTALMVVGDNGHYSFSHGYSIDYAKGYTNYEECIKFLIRSGAHVNTSTLNFL